MITISSHSLGCRKVVYYSNLHILIGWLLLDVEYDYGRMVLSSQGEVEKIYNILYWDIPPMTTLVKLTSSCYLGTRRSGVIHRFTSCPNGKICILLFQHKTSGDILKDCTSWRWNYVIFPYPRVQSIINNCLYHNISKAPISVEIKRNVAYVCILKTDNVVLYSDIWINHRGSNPLNVTP